MQFKAYITQKNKDGQEVVVIKDQTLVLDITARNNFINRLSMKIHLGAFKIDYPNGTKLKILTAGTDAGGCYVNISTDEPGFKKHFATNKKFIVNVPAIGSISATYGVYDSLPEWKWLRFILGPIIQTKRLLKINMLYDGF